MELSGLGSLSHKPVNGHRTERVPHVTCTNRRTHNIGTGIEVPIIFVVVAVVVVAVVVVMVEG